MLLRLAMLLFISLELTQAMQCDCLGSDREDRHRAEIVFRGTVIAYQKGDPLVVFRVTLVFKGDPTEIFEMPAIESVGACFGFSLGMLKVGNELLVYASSFGSTWPADLSVKCATKLWSETKNIGKLGRGRKPRSKQPTTLD
jgi:hypothetical protein